MHDICSLLEIIEKDTNVTLFKGEDHGRAQAERVERFLPRICDNITVFDTKEYHTPGIDDTFREILTPMIMAAIYAPGKCKKASNGNQKILSQTGLLM